MILLREAVEDSPSSSDSCDCSLFKVWAFHRVFDDGEDATCPSVRLWSASSSMGVRVVVWAMIGLHPAGNHGFGLDDIAVRKNGRPRPSSALRAEPDLCA